MSRRIGLLLLMLFAALLANSIAQAPSQDQKTVLMKQYSSIANTEVLNKGPDLRPSLWVNCLCRDKCEEPLGAKNYILVDDMQIYVYNIGETFSGSASGKVEFFDVLSNRNISVDFTTGSAPSKSYAKDITPVDINGPFLIKKDAGISISLTYKGITTKPITHRNTIRECSILE